jgi:hypothetical protein
LFTDKIVLRIVRENQCIMVTGEPEELPT